jgi:hypothetical protein
MSGKSELLRRRLDRRYARLCVIRRELEGLDFKKAKGGSSFEDFVLSQTDFSPYREIPGAGFAFFDREGLGDFDESFFPDYLGLSRAETLALIGRSYRKEGAVYRLVGGNPLILSVMRTLQTSLELGPLIRPEEVPGPPGLFRTLAYKLDGTVVTHEDGMTTTLFISPRGDLSGTFRPGNKPWTLVLIPSEKIPALP